MKHDFNPSYVAPRPDILVQLPARFETVLDIGCSNGAVGRSLKQTRQVSVTGIEYDPAMAAVAATNLDNVVVGSIEAPGVLEKLGNQRFDVIICADVLEHLSDPWTIIGRLREYLGQGGCLIASIPNIRHISTIYSLAVTGHWPYRDRGIHDRTHMRFFTLKNIQELFIGAGLKIEKLETNYRLVERPHAINKHANKFAIGPLKPFLAFQYLVCAKRRVGVVG